jgi:hypothetical protein
MSFADQEGGSVARKARPRSEVIDTIRSFAAEKGAITKRQKAGKSDRGDKTFYKRLNAAIRRLRREAGIN